MTTLPGAWCYRASAGTGRPDVSILWLGEMESLVCNFCLSVAARETVWAYPPLRYTSMLLGRSATNKQQLHKLYQIYLLADCSSFVHQRVFTMDGESFCRGIAAWCVVGKLLIQTLQTYLSLLSFVIARRSHLTRTAQATTVTKAQGEKIPLWHVFWSSYLYR